MLHHVAQGGEAAVMHVGRGERDVAQGRHAEFAEIALLQLDMARARSRRPGWVVVAAAEQVMRVASQPLDSLVPTGVDLSLALEKRDAGVAELAVCELRAEVAD